MTNEFTDFEKIVSELLDTYEKNLDADVETIIAQVAAGMGLDQDAMAQIDATNKAVDDIHQKFTDLKNAKKEGKTTGEWLGEQLDQTLSQDPNATDEDKQNAFDQITEALDKEMINLISEEKDNSIH